MALGTMQMNGKTYVLVPQDEYRRLTESEPPMPRMHNDGTYPAVSAARVTIARTILRGRRMHGLSQKALAQAAGIPVVTLNRIEKAKVTADSATIAKIDRALKKASKATTSAA